MKLSNKFCLVFAGFLLSIIIIEIIFQIMGFAVYYHQRQGYIKENKNFENHYRILALGESTTADLYNGEGSWPAVLEMILNNRSKKIKFKVFNEGVPGATSQILLSRLSRNLDMYKPDLVITMLGYNDPLNSRVYYSEYSLNKFKLPKFIRWVNINLASKHGNDFKICNEFPNQDFQNAISNAQLLIDSYKLEEALKSIELVEINFSYCYSHCEIGRLYNQVRNKLVLDKKKGIYEKAKINYEMGAEYGNECRIQLIYLYLMKAEDSLNYHDAKKIVENLLIKDHMQVDENQGQIFGTFIEVLGRDNISENSLPGFFYLYGYDNLIYSHNSLIYNSTRINYNLINKIVQDKGIRHLAMQYPRQDVDLLKKYFDELTEISFISNQENFEKVLDSYSWNEVFIDTMGYDNKSKYGGKPFGHATLLGNKLIAENAADIILKELNITS